MRLMVGGRARGGWLLLAASGPLLVAAAWFMFHNPTIHGVPLNGDDEVRIGDWTCLAPYDITLFGASNEYGGNEVADSAYARTHCDAAGHESFAIGAAAATAVVCCLAGAVRVRGATGSDR